MAFFVTVLTYDYTQISIQTFLILIFFLAQLFKLYCVDSIDWGEAFLGPKILILVATIFFLFFSSLVIGLVRLLGG